MLLKEQQKELDEQLALILQGEINHTQRNLQELTTEEQLVEVATQNQLIKIIRPEALWEADYANSKIVAGLKELQDIKALTMEGYESRALEDTAYADYAIGRYTQLGFQSLYELEREIIGSMQDMAEMDKTEAYHFLNEKMQQLYETSIKMIQEAEKIKDEKRKEIEKGKVKDSMNNMKTMLGSFEPGSASYQATEVLYFAYKQLLSYF